VAQLRPVNRKTTLNKEKQEVNKKRIALIVTVFCSDNFTPNYASKNLSIKNHTCAKCKN
jgi:hypothetical protein